ncbi:MAG: hypothetical protein JO352_39910 [Chloroflexi bacterium]|nr:hypothetical protein [Chloroflexota bacterium]
MTTLIQPAREIERRIPLPREDRPPLKVNIFERMQSGNCQLIPLFPYEDADSLVPAGAIFRGEPNADFGQFFHLNSVDEVAHVFGANGALLQTGQIYATQPLHGVNSFLKDPRNPDNFLVIAVTQHQRPDGPQNEAVIFRCAKCHEVLERNEYDAQPAPRGMHPRNGVPLFTTLQGSVDAAETLNEHETNRHCASCGHDNPTFPLERWGWKQYVQQTRTVNDARHALDAAAAEAFGSAEAGGQ